MTSHSSPNRIVWQFYEALRRSAVRARGADERHVQQEVAVSIFLAVTTVEVFLNVFFRLVVEEEGYREYKEQLLQDLLPPFLSLDKKIKQWPRQILGTQIDLDAGPGREFVDLKNLRNKLMHFTSTHETLKLPGFRVEGLPNTAVFDSLTVTYSERAVGAVEGFLQAVFGAKGLSVGSVSKNLHFWTGKVPTKESTDDTR